ncbi:hypothetical protein [Nitratireductor basaltis]|uniref:HNH endonuclease n=1 Tax=Nitratireductor basaltis TaxID=472175 RepID=A0A084U5R2_9HYPH|nr:hypothetical protein [Nitratireductor basaltis]KFB08298.1 hypothetical protein EL18_02547 [Nitratireductor basaltis]
MRRKNLSEADKRYIIAQSGGCCNNCRKRLFRENSFGERVRLGDDAHIVAASDAGPRGASHLDASARSSSENMLLLCKNCHAEIDQQPQLFTVERLLKIRERHYSWIDHCLGQPLTKRPKFHYLSYINVPRADMYAAAQSLSLPQASLNGAESISDLGIDAGRLMYRYVSVLNHDVLFANELSHETSIEDIDVGQYWYTPNSAFRSKNILRRYSEAVPTAWNRQECVIYRKVNDWRLVCLIDPRWITTTTAWATLSSGSFQSAALVHVASIDAAQKTVLASPIFLGAPEALRL